MRNHLTRRLSTALVAALGLVLLCAVPQFIEVGHAQTYTIVKTSLSAPLSAPAQGQPNTLVSVASVTNIAAPTATAPGSEIFVDGEAMLVLNVSGSVLTVARGWDGTLAAGHASGAVVYAGPASGAIGGPFVFSNPALGSCTLSNELYGVRINVRNGMIWNCSTIGWRSQYGGAPLGFYSGQTAGTAVTSITEAQSGSTFAFDAASGNNYKLPPPQVGLSYDFINTATITSNAAEIQTDGSATFMQGSIHVGGVATTIDFACNGTSHVAIKENGTTTGGILGGRLHLVAVSATKWQVDGILFGSGTGATPCATTP